MTERLADITARIDGVRQLGAVVNAMRGIAAARVQQARDQLTAVDRYTATIATAIGRTLAMVPESAVFGTRPAARTTRVVFVAEQGFAGAFSEHVLDAVRADAEASEIILIGTRGTALAAERGVVGTWTHALPSHSASIPKLADAVLGALYARIATGQIDRLDAVFSQWRPGHGTHVERRHLFPFDVTALPPMTDANPPLTNLRPQALLWSLTGDYMHAQLCDAALHSFAAENQARMEAMAAARAHIERQLAALQGAQRRVRQDAITAEIIELAAGETASKRRRAGAGGPGSQ